MGKIKLLALDLDGSLLQNNQEISEANRYWIKQAEAAGMIVSFATGRGRTTSIQYWDAVSPKSPMVVVNGAEVWLNHNELLSRHFLPVKWLKPLHDLVVEHDTGFWLQGSSGLLRQEDWTDEHLNGTEFLKFGVLSREPEVIERLRAIISEWPELEVTSSAPSNLEVSSKGINKASGLAEIAEALDIEPASVAVVGDSLNDLAMFKWAGFGAAMGNAVESVKAVADYVTATNEEDGVAQVIQLLLEQN